MPRMPTVEEIYRDFRAWWDKSEDNWSFSFGHLNRNDPNVQSLAWIAYVDGAFNAYKRDKTLYDVREAQ